MSYTKPKFKIGDIVSVLSNPYTDIDIEKIPDASDEIVSIQSDSDFIPPFMTITEVAKIPGKDNEIYDTETGFKKVKGFSCKCVYFNSLTRTFEEKWFPEKFLKSYTVPEAISKNFIDVKADTDLNDYLGEQVILKTWKLESTKRKAYLKVDSKSLDSNNQVTTALLKHLPPVMTVIGFMKPKESKNVEFDKKEGDGHKKHSIHLLKCQWYNPKTGCFSENVIPLESLSLVKEVNLEVFRKLKEAVINKNQYSIVTRGNAQIYALPIRVVYNHCEYVLIYEDLISGKTYPLQISELESELTLKDLDLNYAPKVDGGALATRGILNQSIVDFIEDSPFYYRLQYIDHHQRITLRTISEIVPYEEDGKKYFRAHCHLRDAQRTFLLDNILQVKKLFPIEGKSSDLTEGVTPDK